MSFQIDWPSFSLDFLERAKIQITSALNKSNTPTKICDLIQAKELFMVNILDVKIIPGQVTPGS
jgi:hypothetical protein